MRLLWVEDHAGFVRMAGRFLSCHEVMVAGSVAAARAALAAGAFDAAIIDYDLEDGKGTEVVALLRQDGGATPVLAASSHDFGNAELMKAGADAVCPKTAFDRVAEALAKLRHS